MLNKKFDTKINYWKQKFNADLVKFREEAYKLDNMMPKRYCLILTNQLQPNL